MHHSESKGKGDSEIRKKILRKDSKGTEKIKDDKRNCDGKSGSETKMEFMKLLGRKESKSKERDDKDGRGKESEKEDRMEEDFLLVKTPPVNKENNIIEGDTEECNEQEGIEDDKDKADSGHELKVDQPKSRSVTPEHPKPEIGECKPNNHDAKKHSRFRLKEQLTKLDARFRKAFSSEHSSSIDINSEIYIDEIAIIGPDGEMKVKEVEDTDEYRVDSIDYVEEAEEMKEDYENTNEGNDDRDIHEMKSSTLSVTPRSSPKETPRSSPKPTPKTTPRPSPVDESIILEQELAEEEKSKEDTDLKSSLALFDKDGNPVPPPRRKVRLAEAKQKGSKSSLNNFELLKDSSVSQSHSYCQGAGNIGPLTTSPVEKEETLSDRRKCFQRSQGSEATPAQTPSHLVAAPTTVGTNITSPNSKGAFKTFVSHLTKRGSSHALQGMLFCSPLGIAKTLLLLCVLVLLTNIQI